MIAERAAGTMKKVSIELGGNAPYIVFDNASICKFRCSAQTCVCASRLYVQRGIHDAFVEALLERMKKFKVGSGMDPTVTYGRLVNKAAVAKAKSHIDDAVSNGAKLIFDGNIRDDVPGYFIEPALVTSVTSDMAAARDETFGPLAPIFVFDTLEGVLRMANDTEFGLAGYFISNNMDTTWRAAAELEVSKLGVNTGKISAAKAPFGGIKESGLGKEGSKYRLAEFQAIENITISM
ncbi:Fc.00g034090.m01.CDS01 [Cosmosporella sp. VM-42]